jgi:hypothetical protein
MGARQGGGDDATNHVPPMMREMLLDRSSVLLLTSLDATVRLDAHADHRESPHIEVANY